MLNLLFNKERSTCCKSPEEITRSLFPGNFVWPNQSTKFPEKFHFTTASKIYFGASLVNKEAFPISLLESPNSSLYFNFGEYAKPLNFKRALLTNRLEVGLDKPLLTSQFDVPNICILALTFMENELSLPIKLKRPLPNFGALVS